MDYETIAEACFEIGGAGSYKLDAINLLNDEITSGSGLTNIDKAILIQAITEVEKSIDCGWSIAFENLFMLLSIDQDFVTAWGDVFYRSISN